MASLLNDPKLEALLDRLHGESDKQVDATSAYFRQRRLDGTLDYETPYDDDLHGFLSDKMVALDRDKGEFCYQLIRALRARRVIEAGTSFGVSTLYLAAAVRDNQIENGVVIGTEFEPDKVKIANANFSEAGLSDYIELREGDLRETLKDPGGPVDLLLVDIWEVALPALELVSASLRSGAIVLCDNTTSSADEYRGYFEFINDPKNRLRTMTVPFQGGFELTVRI